MPGRCVATGGGLEISWGTRRVLREMGWGFTMVFFLLVVSWSWWLFGLEGRDQWSS